VPESGPKSFGALEKRTPGLLSSMLKKFLPVKTFFICVLPIQLETGFIDNSGGHTEPFYYGKRALKSNCVYNRFLAVQSQLL